MVKIWSREITVQFNLKKLFIPVLVVLVLVVAIVVLWQLLPKKGAVPIPSDRPLLAVMYFKNNSEFTLKKQKDIILNNIVIKMR